MKNAAITQSIPAIHKGNAARHNLQSSRNSPQIPGNATRSASCAEQFARFDKLVSSLRGTRKGPRIVFVYQDDEARVWAKEISERIAVLAGNEGVQASWWRISDLTAPGILAGAVSSALRADLIVVASRAEGLSFPFYVWVNLWWPNRSESPGALVALVGVAARTASRSDRIGDYLRVVAEQARMSFLSLERPLASASKKEFSNGKSHSYLWNGHLHD
jgi:hypothetical protein